MKLMSYMDFTAIIKKGKKQFVALCPEVDVVSQGHSIEEAIKNLKEAVEVYIEEMEWAMSRNLKINILSFSLIFINLSYNIRKTFT